jgi:hypothetical protein
MIPLTVRMAGQAPDAEPTASDEISSAAAEMLRRFPSDAAIRAEARYDALLAVGKVDKAIRWWRIKETIARPPAVPRYGREPVR